MIASLHLPSHTFINSSCPIHRRNTLIPRTANIQTRESRSVGVPPDWIEAYQKFYYFWVSIARSSSLSEEDAKDVVHAVIESALAQDLSRFESLDHIRNYVARGVLNRVILFFQRGHRTTEFTERIDSQIAERVAEPDHDQQLIRSVLLEGMRALPKKDSEIIKLKMFGGYTFQQIGELLHLPVSTLKSREDSAIKKLRKSFRKRGLIDD